MEAGTGHLMPSCEHIRKEGEELFKLRSSFGRRSAYKYKGINLRWKFKESFFSSEQLSSRAVFQDDSGVRTT